MSHLLEQLFRDLSYHIGEGAFSEETEDLIVALEEQYLETESISTKDLLWLTQLRKGVERDE